MLPLQLWIYASEFEAIYTTLLSYTTPIEIILEGPTAAINLWKRYTLPPNIKIVKEWSECSDQV